MMDVSHKAIKGSDVFLWIAVALVVRLVAMLACLHPDIIFVNFFPSKLAYEGVWDIYRYISVNFPGDKMWSYYPPMTYFTLGASQAALKALMPGFGQWITEMYFGDIGKWLVTYGASVTLNKYLFFMKLPYLMFDGICLFAVWKYSAPRGGELTALRLWSLNPVILYGIYMFGQVDIMPAALAAAAILLMSRGRTATAFLLLSTAALFKTFTIFIILPLFIISSRNIKDAMKNIAAVAAPFILIFLPLYLSGKGEALQSLFPKFFQVSGDQFSYCKFVNIGVFAAFYLWLLVIAFLGAGKRPTDHFILKVSIAALMLVYVYSMATFPATVHHFVWVVPILIMAVCSGILPEWLYWLQMLFLFIYNLNSAYTTTGMLAPLDPRFFLALPGLPDMMHELSIKWGMIMLAGQLAFVAVCVVMATDMLGLTSFIKRRTEER